MGGRRISDNPKEEAGVLDGNGFVYVDIKFLRAHPQWYAYLGTFEENGVTVHSFMLIE